MDRGAQRSARPTFIRFRQHAREESAAIQAEFDAAIHEVLSGERGDLFLQANQRFWDAWFCDLNSGPLRITVFTSAKAPERGYGRVLVEIKVKDLDSDSPEVGKLFYPEDETVPGFQRFAALVRKYVGQSGR